jgi:sugar phosphate isomerase/epimerase
MIFARERVLAVRAGAFDNARMFPMKTRSNKTLIALTTATLLLLPASHAAAFELFSRSNLVAWCIVPFDAKKRGPEERAQMLDRLELRRLAYDYRAEHIPTFDAEVEAMKRHGIELAAWWFPTTLNDEAKGILNVIERHKITPQLWVMGGGPATKDEAEQRARVESEAARLRPIVGAAAKLGCKVALYNHGSWFGEPENQIAIVERLRRDGVTNAGIVYNFHHGHEHLARFGELFRRMQPHLLAVNLNGMVRDGEQRKILHLAEGDRELAMLKTIRDSGWQGPVGIIDHRPETDSEETLRNNLRGLDWLLKEMEKPGSGGARPFKPVAAVAPIAAPVAIARAAVGSEPEAQKEGDWVDDRWSKTDVGWFHSSVLALPNGKIAKGLAVRVGENGEAAVAYDLATMTLRAGWTNGFLKFDPARYGLLNAPKPAGKITFTGSAKPAWGDAKVKWRGLRVNGNRVALEYEVNGVLVRETPWCRVMRVGGNEVIQITREIASDSLPKITESAIDTKISKDLEKLKQAGSPRWQPLTTRGQIGFGNDAYVIDTLTVPYDNPWKALFFTSGVDFLPNGDAAVCTIHGDVWLVSGIDDKLQKLTWRRFATGLHQPLGLRVRDGKIFVLGRDQITRLHDENSDGEADFYECFTQQIDTSTGGHDYVTGLETDRAGNFYYVDPKGVHRVSPDGARRETIAAGWRNPNGLGVSPDGRVITVAPQEGNWTPSSAICEARTDGWYGYAGPRVTPARPLGYNAPLCWIPHAVDNSGGSQVWAPADWGPLGGRMLHFSFGRCAWLAVLRETIGDTAQGGVVPLPGKFLSGAMRGAFNPRDGQLYVVGTRGWQTSAVRDGCLQRVRFTGKPLRAPLELHAHTNGLRITFSDTLDRSTAEDAGSFAVTEWNYRYAASYGSKDWSALRPNVEGRDELAVKSARLLPDGKTVFLEIPGLAPVMQMQIKYSLQCADGSLCRGAFYNTINRLGPAGP